jgi:hypothetical protein
MLSLVSRDIFSRWTNRGDLDAVLLYRDFIHRDNSTQVKGAKPGQQPFGRLDVRFRLLTG